MNITFFNQLLAFRILITNLSSKNFTDIFGVLEFLLFYQIEYYSNALFCLTFIIIIIILSWF